MPGRITLKTIEERIYFMTVLVESSGCTLPLVGVIPPTSIAGDRDRALDGLNVRGLLNCANEGGSGGSSHRQAGSRQQRICRVASLPGAPRRSSPRSESSRQLALITLYSTCGSVLIGGSRALCFSGLTSFLSYMRGNETEVRE